MRHLYILTFLLCLFTIPALQAQPPVGRLSEGIPENLIQPVYPGGEGAFQNYVSSHVKKLKSLKSQRLKVNFIIEKDGSLSHITFSEGAERRIKKIVRKALKDCERWTPGIVDGKIVRVSYTLPIIIDIR